VKAPGQRADVRESGKIGAHQRVNEKVCEGVRALCVDLDLRKGRSLPSYALWLGWAGLTKHVQTQRHLVLVVWPWIAAQL
jgi:hypothetical protein